MTGRAAKGFVLVAVLLVTLATWALLAALLASAYLHYRLALGAERGAVAGAAAEGVVTVYLEEARAVREVTGDWPAPAVPLDDAACTFDLVEVAAADAWWRVRVRAGFEGAVAWREGTVHAAP